MTSIEYLKSIAQSVLVLDILVAIGILTVLLNWLFSEKK